MEHGRIQGFCDANNRKLGPDRSGYPNHSEFCHLELAEANQIRPENLFGGTPDDPAAGFRRRVREIVAEQREQAGATWSSSKREDDPVDDPKDEDKDDEADEDDEDEEEEEDPGYYDSGDDEEDDDSPPASSHRPVTLSTLKKKPISRPRKAYRNQSRPGSSSRQRTRDRQ